MFIKLECKGTKKFSNFKNISILTKQIQLQTATFFLQRQGKNVKKKKLHYLHYITR
jgi:hypothetical protein